MLVAAAIFLVARTWYHNRYLPQNLIVLRVSAAMFDPIRRLQLHKELPVDDDFLGTHETGKSVSAMTVEIEFKPDVERARVLLTLRGEALSQTTGESGPAILEGNTTTDFTATKEITFDEQGFRTSPAVVRGHSDVETQLAGTTRRLGHRIVERIAENRIEESENEANQIAWQKAKAQIARQFDAQADRYVTELNERLALDEILRKHVEADDTVELQFHTTDEHMWIRMTRLGGNRDNTPAFPDTALPMHVGLNIFALAANLEALEKVFVNTKKAYARLRNEPFFATKQLPNVVRAEANATAVKRQVEDTLSKVEFRELGRWTILGIGETIEVDEPGSHVRADSTSQAPDGRITQ